MDKTSNAPTGMDRLALPAIFLIALLLRVREAVRAPLWYDELYSQAAVHRPWHQVMEVMRADVHPPLIYMLSFAWKVFGDSDLAVRSLSIVFGMATLAVGYALARELFGRPAALIATALLAVHPWHIYISQEARSYPELWFFLTTSAFAAWRFCASGQKSDRATAALFVVSAALALWTHYLAGIVLFVQFVWGALALRREPKRLGMWVLLHVAVAALFAPVVPMLWQQFHRVETDHWMPRPTFADVIDLARRISLSAMYLVPVVLGLALLPLLPERTRRPALFALTIGPLTVLLCWVLGIKGLRLFASKYMLFSLTAIFALVAAGIARLPGRITPWIVTGVLLLFAGRASLIRTPYPEAAGLGQARAALTGHVHEGDVFYHADSHTLLFAERYFPQARHRLLLMGQRFPYFEGGHLVADSSRGDVAELDATVASGSRWFAMAAAPAGIDTHPAAALFDSLAGLPQKLGVVRVWTSAAAR
jgi:uncharacterized membrane protein